MAGVWGRSFQVCPRQRDGRVEPETTALDCTCLWLGADKTVEASDAFGFWLLATRGQIARYNVGNGVGRRGPEGKPRVGMHQLSVLNLAFGGVVEILGFLKLDWVATRRLGNEPTMTREPGQHSATRMASKTIPCCCQRDGGVW